MTTRINISLPDELAAAVRDRMPGLNVSGVVQRALAELIDCRHHELGCAACGGTINRAQLVDAALSRFYGEIMWQLREPVGRCDSAEGAARVIKSIAQGWDISTVETTGLPRPTRSQRERVHAQLVAEAIDGERAQYREPAARPARRARSVA